MRLMRRLSRTSASKSVILIRLMVGAVFLSEGIQKILFPESVGAERFAKIGFRQPELTAGLVACFEIVCGGLILLGLVTRAAVIPTITIMLVAIGTTKLPILRQSGFWKMAHESRTDYAMLLGSLFLMIQGGGTWSADRLLFERLPKAKNHAASPTTVPRSQ